MDFWVYGSVTYFLYGPFGVFKRMLLQAFFETEGQIPDLLPAEKSSQNGFLGVGTWNLPELTCRNMI